METALTVSLIWAAVTWLVFLVWYLVRATWWKSPFGWNTVAASFIFTILFGRLMMLYLDPDVKGDLAFTGLLIYILSGAVAVHRTILLEKVQRIQEQGQGNSDDH